MKYVTAKVFPVGPDGAFQSEPAEAAYQQAVQLGSTMPRDQFRLIIQAYQCAQDEAHRKYEAWKADREKASANEAPRP